IQGLRQRRGYLARSADVGEVAVAPCGGVAAWEWLSSNGFRSGVGHRGDGVREVLVGAVLIVERAGAPLVVPGSLCEFRRKLRHLQSAIAEEGDVPGVLLVRGGGVLHPALDLELLAGVELAGPRRVEHKCAGQQLRGAKR